jgi:hypothetical protein
MTNLWTNELVSRSAPVRKLGPETPLPIFHLLPPSPQTDPPQAQHRFGLGNPALPHQKNSIRFFNLLPDFLLEHPTLGNDLG